MRSSNISSRMGKTNISSRVRQEMEKNQKKVTSPQQQEILMSELSNYIQQKMFSYKL